MKKHCCLAFCILLSAVRGISQTTDTLLSDTLLLPDVIIEADRPAIVRKADRMIVDVEHSNILKARSLSQILDLIPGVNSDGEGNITVMGNGVRIYDNGKTVSLSGKRLKYFLSSMRGQDIKSIEIISLGSAKYEAEGGGAIVQIIRRRQHGYGISVYGGGEYGHKGMSSYSGFAGLTCSWGKFAIYTKMTAGKLLSKMNVTEKDYQSGLTMHTQTQGNEREEYYLPKIGLDYNITASHYLGIEWSGNFSRSISDNCLISSEITKNSIDEMRIQSSAPYVLQPRMNNATINYEWRIDTLGSKLGVIADYAASGGHDIYNYASEYMRENMDDSVSFKKQPSNERIDLFSAQIDLTKHFNNNKVLSAGAKFAHAGTRYTNTMFVGSEEMTEDVTHKNNFYYSEQRLAMYQMYGGTFKKWTYNLGLREEYTKWHDRQNSGKGQRDDEHDFKLFPSLFVRKDIGGGNGLSLSYTQAINRPSYQMVNPFVCYISETSYKEGNPKLKGESIYYAALQFDIKAKYIFSLSVSYTDNRINEVFDLMGNNMTRYTLRNDGDEKKIALYMEFPFRCGLWSSRSSACLSGGLYANSTNRVNSFNIALQSYNSFKITKHLTAMLNFRFSKREKRLYLKQKSDYVGIDIEGDYLCCKNRLSINFGIHDVLNSRGQARQVFSNGVFCHYTNYDNMSRNLFLKATFSFTTGSQNTVGQRTKRHSNQEERQRM